jgi:RNA polymerase sigma-70 factor (ECF subfamily)
METEDDNAPEEIIREITRHQSAVTAYIRSLLPTHPDYMDILQEVNVTLWKKRKQYRPGSNFKAWAFNVARYHVMNARRKLAKDATRLVFSEDLSELLADTNPYEDNPVVESKLEALQLCLNSLREQDRKLLSIRYAGGITIEEYARQNQRNSGTVRATLRRLRGTLLNCVNLRLQKEPLPHCNNPID